MKKHPPFYAPGRLLILASDPPGSGKAPENRSGVPSTRDSGTYPTFEEAKKVTWLLHEADQEDLKEIVVSHGASQITCLATLAKVLAICNAIVDQHLVALLPCRSLLGVSACVYSNSLYHISPLIPRLSVGFQRIERVHFCKSFYLLLICSLPGGATLSRLWNVSLY